MPVAVGEENLSSAVVVLYKDNRVDSGRLRNPQVQPIQSLTREMASIVDIFLADCIYMSVVSI